jgi:two-component system sensor histidine kinase LytS
MTPLPLALGTALILAIVKQVRDRDEQTRAAALSEVRALQARMNPHFLFNALNGLAALSRVAPRQVPRATGQLRHFLRASFDQHERLLVKAKRGQVKYRKKRGTRYPIPSTDVSGLLCWPDFAQAHGTD